MFTDFFLLYRAKHGESIVIGLAASSTSKDPQVKTTEPMVSTKVTNCSIQLGWILARDGFAKKYIRSRPGAKKCHFFIWCVRMDGWMDVIVYFVHNFFHTVAPIEMKLKTYDQYSKMKRWLVFGTYRSTNISTLF